MPPGSVQDVQFSASGSSVVLTFAPTVTVTSCKVKRACVTGQPLRHDEKRVRVPGIGSCPHRGQLNGDPILAGQLERGVRRLRVDGKLHEVPP